MFRYAAPSMGRFGSKSPETPNTDASVAERSGAADAAVYGKQIVEIAKLLPPERVYNTEDPLTE